jgi:3',5'-nucleoside bisphosphate phosphatase
MRTLLSLFTLLVAATAAAQPTQVRDTLPVPDVPGYKTLKCDFHMHTVFSDGEVWPITRLVEALRDGLDAIAISDHAAYNPHKDDVKPDLARPYAIARATAQQLGIVLIPAIEVNDEDIHYNAIFLTDPNALVGVGLKEALVRAKAQGGFAFWNHPGWKATPQWLPTVADLYRSGLFQGMELVNGSSFYPEAYPWIEERKLTILANSDVHRPMWERRRKRPVTLVFALTADAAGIKEALLARRTAAWANGEVWGFEPHLAALWSGAVKPQPAEIAGTPGSGIALRLQNGSAIPFQLRYRSGPTWLKSPGATLAPESTAGLALMVAKNAPAGKQQVELEFEVTNLHTGPGRNLVVRVPLTILL